MNWNTIVLSYLAGAASVLFVEFTAIEGFLNDVAALIQAFFELWIPS